MFRAPRFAPPPLAWSAELEWVLLRAFGPVEVFAPAPADAQVVLRLAKALDLASRIGARVPRAVIAGELGEAVAEEFIAAYHGTAAANLVALAVAREVATIAAAVPVPVVFLKSTALLLSAVTPIGARNAADVDILLRNKDIPTFRATLRAAGYVGGADSHKEHQLAPMYHPAGVMIEVHRAVKGVRPAGARRWAGLSQYRDLGALATAPGLPAGIFVPSPPALAAHALVHGIVQHGAHPGTYPQLRVAADLVDLARSGGEIDAEVLREWVERTVRPSEVSSLLLLSRYLAIGDIQGALGDAAASWWLRHALACLKDPAYREYLRILGIVWDEANAPAGLMLLRKVWHAVALPKQQLEARYGPIASPTRRALVTIVRPFDLVIRLARYLSSHLKYRRWLRRTGKARAGK